jgi:hypothetical protein
LNDPSDPKVAAQELVIPVLFALSVLCALAGPALGIALFVLVHAH